MSVCYQRWCVVMGLIRGGRWSRGGEERREAVDFVQYTSKSSCRCGQRGEAYGRKLQAEAGRWDTRVKISEMRRC